MNNNNEDQGQRNAATLTRILEARRRARVPRLVTATPEALAPSALPTDSLIEGSAWVTEEASTS
jgi:hypothetical protein